MQNLRDHIASPIVQKNIRERVQQAKRIIEKKNNTKEDIASLKALLLHLEDGFARVQENEKIYHRLLLQKEIELKKTIENNKLNNTCKYINGEIQESKISTNAGSPYVSIDSGLLYGISRKSQSFSGMLIDDAKTSRKNKRKKIEYDTGENRLIDELAFYKVKYALFEENLSERDEKIKIIMKNIKKTTENYDLNIGMKTEIDKVLEILIRPIDTSDLQLDECLF